MALFGKSSSRSGNTGNSRSGFLSGLLGAREIENRVDESFPSWQEFSAQKEHEAHEREDADKRVELPPHRVVISSPLHGSFLYFLLIVVGLALGIHSPELAPVLIYAGIAVAVAVSLFMVFRDALFFHIEGLRLEADADMINRHTHGPQEDNAESGMGFLRSISRKNRNRKIFRSSLLQIHYQNVLRTFEQGNRRTWVDQDASIAELHTLLTQRGMKLVWTMIEVLPQLGLLGTLVGLMRMFLAFRVDVAAPEIEILAGFATALGTTVVANLFVLLLRPLYMRNERAMNEILSSVQTLMAMFILPTQQTVLERTALSGLMGRPQSPLGMGMSSAPTITPPQAGENKLLRMLEELTASLNQFTETQQAVDSGKMAQETAEIAQEVKETLRGFQEAVSGSKAQQQQRALEQLSEAVQSLAGQLSAGAGRGAANGPSSERIEKDLTQLRVLTHDTLLLLEQIASRMDPPPARRGRILSTDRGVRSEVFDKGEAPDKGASAPGLTSLEDDEEGAGSRIRLFSERT